MKKFDDLGLDFENFLRFELPWLLNLSGSKCVATEIMFSNFADYARMVANKSPMEFKEFFKELENSFQEIYKWRAPKGYVTAQKMTKDDINEYPNGKPKYRLYKK
jgi:hypothetical protein